MTNEEFLVRIIEVSLIDSENYRSRLIESFSRCDDRSRKERAWESVGFSKGIETLYELLLLYRKKVAGEVHTEADIPGWFFHRNPIDSPYKNNHHTDTK